MKDLEIKDREAQMMLDNVEKLRKQDEEAAEKKKQRALQMLRDVQVANDMSKTMKAMEKQKAKEED